MFLGHYAVALGAKPVAPRVSLGTTVVAAQLADLLWPILLLLGIERVRITPGITAFNPLEFTHYPITHSLVGITVLAVVLGAIYFGVTRNRAGAWVVGVLVVSHWFLDAIVHRPDLLLIPGGQTRVGFGLWNSVVGTVVLELVILAIGIYLYSRGTTATDRVGRFGFWALNGVLLLVFVASSFGPPPPSERALAISALAGWLVVAWAYWVDAHRQPGRGPSRAP